MKTKPPSPSLANFESLPDSAFIDVSLVALLFNCSANTVWRRAKAGILPAPVRISPQQTRWRVVEIRQALASAGNYSECA